MQLYTNSFQKRQMLLAAAAVMLTMTTAVIGETGMKATSCAAVDINGSLEPLSSCKDAVKPVVDKSNQNLLKELLQPDTSLLAELERKEDPPTIDENSPTIPQTDVMEPAP